MPTTAGQNKGWHQIRGTKDHHWSHACIIIIARPRGRQGRPTWTQVRTTIRHWIHASIAIPKRTGRAKGQHQDGQMHQTTKPATQRNNQSNAPPRGVGPNTEPACNHKGILDM